MIIKKLNYLNKKQRKEMNELINICLKTDGLERVPYFDNDCNYFVELDSFYLLYEDKKLVSILTIFAPFEEEVEISAYTLPEERNKGYFTALMNEAKRELTKFQITRILFVVEPKSVDGIALAKKCANYVKSEYLLAKDIAEWKRCEELPTSIKLKKLQVAEVTNAAQLSTEIFDTDIEENLSILEEVNSSKQMNSYCLYLSADMIGICNISYGTNSSCIFGLGISPTYQGKGYGRWLIILILEQLSKENIKRVTLQVGSENEKAFYLYKKFGFTIEKQYDYYQYMK